jgi:hypothetical protein
MRTEERFVLSLDDLPGLDRRALMRHAILLVGGSVAAASPAAALSQKAAKQKRFFTPAQFAVLSEYAETVIPRTSSPGAKDAGVPESIDALMRNWASRERQAQFRTLMEKIGGTGFMKMNAKSRLAFVQRFDDEQLTASEPSYVKFKELLLTTYYLSEEGATKELRYELIPGKFEGFNELASDTPAWAD